MTDAVTLASIDATAGDGDAPMAEQLGEVDHAFARRVTMFGGRT